MEVNTGSLLSVEEKLCVDWWLTRQDWGKEQKGM